MFLALFLWLFFFPVACLFFPILVCLLVLVACFSMTSIELYFDDRVGRELWGGSEKSWGKENHDHII